MKVLHSHNDMWNNPQVIKAYQQGCNLFEVDIIWCGGVYLSHSWRPFKCMTFGSLKEYMKKLKQICLNEPERDFYLYVEFKSGNKKIRQELYRILKNKPDNLNILVDSINLKWYHKSRFHNMREFFLKYIATLDLTIHSAFRTESGKDYHKLKLYGKRKWWWR